jgi:hypothetical protein
MSITDRVSNWVRELGSKHPVIPLNQYALAIGQKKGTAHQIIAYDVANLTDQQLNPILRAAEQQLQSFPYGLVSLRGSVHRVNDREQRMLEATVQVPFESYHEACAQVRNSLEVIADREYNH